MTRILLSLLLLSAAQLHAQTRVSSATLGAMEARALGPGTMSGRITAIEGVAEDGKTLYVGTAGGGIWKTTNAGASFKPIFDRYCQSIGALALDPKNPKVVWAGTGESNMRNSVSIGNGLYKSTDGGDNWTRTGLDSTEHISKIVVHPQDPNTVYVAAPGPLWKDSPHRGLYKTTDGGTTWSKIHYVNDRTGCADISIDPSNPATLYATTWEFRRTPYSFNSGGKGSGIFKSTDGGATWKELTTGLPPKPFGRTALALAPSAPANLLAIVESEKTGLYISSDGGATWKAQSATLNVVSRPFYFSTLVVDPKDPKRVYRPAYSFSYSSDGGYSFAEASNEGGWVHSDHHALWINPNNTSQLYLGTDGGVYLSLDRGATWTFMSNLPVGQFYHAAADNATPYRIFGGLQDNGSWMAPSAAPGGVGNGHWTAIYGGDGFWTVPDPTNANFAYAEYQGGNMYRVNLTTLKSVSIKPQPAATDGKLRWNWNTPIVTGSANPRNLYTGAQYLFRSKDRGATWQRISPDLTTNDPAKQKQEENGGLSADNTSAENHCTIFSIAESPVDERIVWAGTDDGRLQLTSDGGKTWTDVSAAVARAGVPKGTWVSSIEPGHTSPDVVYATFDNHMYGDHKTYAARSRDRGRTWEVFRSPEFTGFAHVLRADTKNESLLFLGTEMGLFASVDGGREWFRMKNRIPEYALVRDIRIHPRTHDLILATHGRGILVVDDISPLRNLDSTVLEKSVHLFAPAPAPLRSGQFGDGGFPPTGGWNGGNPPPFPPVQYYLKDRPATGEVKLEILDEKGNVVQSMPGSRRKGLNKVTWNMRMTPPKVAGGGVKPDNSGFVAPMVLPGTYTLRLKVGEETFTQPWVLVHDSANADYTEADRALQYKTSMDLFALHGRLHALTEKIAARAKTAGKEEAAALETLRATLLATKKASIFADEVQLRERISEVYTAVALQEARPSNLQVERVGVLEGELAAAEKAFAGIEKKFGGGKTF